MPAESLIGPFAVAAVRRQAFDPAGGSLPAVDGTEATQYLVGIIDAYLRQCGEGLLHADREDLRQTFLLRLDARLRFDPRLIDNPVGYTLSALRRMVITFKVRRRRLYSIHDLNAHGEPSDGTGRQTSEDLAEDVAEFLLARGAGELIPLFRAWMVFDMTHDEIRSRFRLTQHAWRAKRSRLLRLLRTWTGRA